MIKGNYTPSRIVILGAIGVMCAMTWTVIGTVASVVVLVFMVDQIVFGGCGGKWLYRKVMLRQPFIIYIEPRKTAEQKVVLASLSSFYLLVNASFLPQLNSAYTVWHTCRTTAKPNNTPESRHQGICLKSPNIF